MSAHAAETTGTGAAAGAALIAGSGVSTAFGVPGQRVLSLVDELASAGVEVVLTRHEQGAAFMADAYARVKGFGCCFGTSGPGATNLLTGVAAAYMDSIPMLAITAQAATREFGRYGIQEGTGLGRTPHIGEMFAATCKLSVCPMTPEELVEELPRAIELAAAGRPGPVHVDVPSDLLLEPVSSPARPPSLEHPLRLLPDAAAMQAAVRRLSQARRPLLLIGNGAVRSGAAPKLLALAERFDIPVAGTFLAKTALDERHPLVLGPVGLYGRPEANEALHREADLVCAVGVSFNYMTTAAWTARLEGERLIRVDIDDRELTNNYAAAVTLRADALSFADALGEQLVDTVGGGQERVQALRGRSGPDDDRAAAGTGLHPVDVCEAVSRNLDETTTVIADVGQNAYWVERHVRTRGNGRFLINGGLGSMGHGVTGAIGAWLAGRDEGRRGRIVCTCGDGGLMMGALELSTARDVEADVTWVVFNNGTLGTQRNWFVQSGRPLTACELPPTDYVALARAQGVAAERVSTLEDLDRALERSARSQGPRLIDVPIDPDAVPAPYSPPG